jgi:uncharacterized membrane protein YbhN (UPF0104 family)
MIFVSQWRHKPSQSKRVTQSYQIDTVKQMLQHNIDLLLVMSFTSFAVILSGVIPTPAGIGPFEFVYLLLISMRNDFRFSMAT